jgi:tetratricopeptide (TPR) repeat protein
VTDTADILLFLTQLDYEAGDFAQSRKHGEEALALVVNGERHNMIGRSLMTVSWSAGAIGNYDQAAGYVERAHREYEMAKNRLLVFEQLHHLGTIRLKQGKLADARAYLERALPLLTEIDWVWGGWRVRRTIGRLLYHEGNYPAAREQLSACLEFFQSEAAQRHGDNPWRVDEAVFETLIPLADLERVEGDYAATQQNLWDALRLLHRIPIFTISFTALAAIAELLAAQSRSVEAAELAALVYEHPKAFAQDKDRATRVLTSLQAALTPEAFASAVGRGRMRDLEATVRELVREGKI